MCQAAACFRKTGAIQTCSIFSSSCLAATLQYPPMRRGAKRQLLGIYGLPSAIAIREDIGEEGLMWGASVRLDDYAIDDAHGSVNPHMHVLEILPRPWARRGVLTHEVELVFLGDDSGRHDVEKIRGQNRFEHVRIAFG